MSTYYTILLSSNIRKYGYTSLTYNHIFTSDGYVTECKVSKEVGKESFTGLGYSPTIIKSTETASRLVYEQISVQKEEINKQQKSRAKRFGINSLIIENLHPRTTERDIKDLCSEYGEVKSCSIEEFLSQRQAFVSMDPKEAQLVINNLNGRKLDGRSLSIRFTTRLERPLHPPRKNTIKVENEKQKAGLDQELDEYMSQRSS